MGAISALSTAVSTLKRNGVLFGAALLVTVVNFALALVPTAFSPPMAGLVSLPLSGLSLLVTPFFMGGLLAMADEGLGGTTRFDTFLEGGKANYLRLLGAMVLFAVLFAVLAFVVVLGVAVVGIFAIGVDSTGGGLTTGSGGGIAVVLLLGLVGLLVLLLPMFFLQFYGAAVVVSDLGIVDSLKRSFGLVRRNLVSTLGYSLVAGFVGVLAGIAGIPVTLTSELYGGTSTAGAFPDVSLGLGLLAGVLVLSLVVTTVVSAFGVTYQVAFYEDRLDSTA